MIRDGRARDGECAGRRVREDNQMNRMRPMLARVVVAACAAALAALGAPALPARAERGRPAERVRARPPASWDKATEAVFFADAFDTLDGARPDFAALATVGPPAPGPAPTGAVPRPTGTAWSTLVAPDTIADEIKDMGRRVTAAVASASDFKGGGYDEARVGFSTIALMFAVTAEHDGDVRWKQQAERARDLFARVGSNCKVGTAQSFAEAKLRVDDLAALLDGNSIEAAAEREDDFTWSQVAGRPPLMSRLETADELAAAATASPDAFKKQAERLLHEVEVAAVIGEVIQRPDYEDHDDDTYRGYAAALRDAALDARKAVAAGDYDAARTAVGALKKSCDTCHGDYRG